MKDLVKILIRTSKKQHKQITKQKNLNENDSNIGWVDDPVMCMSHETPTKRRRSRRSARPESEIQPTAAVSEESTTPFRNAPNSILKN